jgi:DNA-binding winged helix-turn-helix (wHTH) protein/tetratricopeptide (TPR) repeat protein
MSLEIKRFGFGDFLLDAKEKVLLRNGKPLSVTPKAFELLLVLVENHGHLLEKDALMKTVWADSFVEEANLTFTVGLLRKALGDNAQKPLFIETVPKRGYRFIADVASVGTVEETADKFALVEDTAAQFKNEGFSLQKFPRVLSESEKRKSVSVVALADWRTEDETKKPEESAIPVSTTQINRKFISAVLFVVPLAVIFALGFYFFSQKSETVGSKKSIAVLPLKPINTANRDEIYEIGIADSLILRLSTVKGFVVRPLSAVRKYADIEQDPLAAGREQKVDYVLATNYQLVNGKIRVTAQLFSVADGQIEETYKSEKDAGDIFAMQDAVAEEVGNILLKRFAVTSNNRAAKRGTTNEEAYRLYLQGMYLCDKRNLADARKAVEVLEQAVRLDPNYALAWAGKAYAHRIIGNHRRSVDTHEEYQKSIAAIEKALALDENLPEAHSALCDNKMYYEYDFDGAERECKRAIEIDPNSSLAHQVYSRFLNSRGRFDEAINEIKTAIDLEPTSFHNQRNLGVSLYFARRYDEAVAQFNRVIATDKDSLSTYIWLCFALEVQGKESEVFDCFMKTSEIQKENEEILKAYKTAFQTSGWKGVLRERLERFEKTDELYFNGAAYSAQIGDKEKAFEYLEKSLQRREFWIANLQVDPRLDSLREDARFKDFESRVRKK